MSGRSVRLRFPIRGRRAERRVETECAVPPEGKPVSRVARMLALAHHLNRLIEAGELQSVAEASRALGLSRARLTQVMGLLQLAPEIQEQVLVGEINGSERRLRKVVKEADWCRQLEICARFNGIRDE